MTAKNGDKIPVADALFTTEKGVGLAITHADCLAVIFYDPVHEAIAVIHAGWRGLVQNILARTVDALHREIGTGGSLQVGRRLLDWIPARWDEPGGQRICCV